MLRACPVWSYEGGGVSGLLFLLSRFLFGRLARRVSPQSFEVRGDGTIGSNSSQEVYIFPVVVFRNRPCFLGQGAKKLAASFFFGCSKCVLGVVELAAGCRSSGIKENQGGCESSIPANASAAR